MRGLDVRYRPGFTPTSNPANSAALHVAPNYLRERGNPPCPLHDGAAGPAHGCGRVGWAHKPRPTGKPPDTLTGPPQNQRRVAAMSQTSVSNRDHPGMYDWQEVPWPQVERKLHKLQRRIYRASQRHDCKTVHALQRLLLRSWHAKLLAVRRVTQDNQGKKTPGIDGIASLEPAERPGPGPYSRPGCPAPTHPSCLDSQARQRRTTTARHPHPPRPRRAGAGQARPGTRMGSQIRAEQLRLSARTFLPRRHRSHSSKHQAPRQVCLGRGYCQVL